MTACYLQTQTAGLLPAVRSRTGRLAFTSFWVPSVRFSLEPVNTMFQNLGWYSPNETLILS